ncbi:hypothetical protein [Natronomonas marina]|jgi:hypothetical protein|uniref:hypothetical protein n=1 Tax=Natronomonas marina TaxID=2961939 RepID=UPI0020CA046F|nr:hypothetical protein [Natronomonas marina]
MRRRRYLAGLALAAVPATAGCSSDGGDPATETEDNEVYSNALRDAVESDGHAVRKLSVGERATLAYSPAEASEAGVRASVSDVARAFFDRVYGGWAVAGLDARVRVDGTLVATWRMERAWIESYLDGDISRDELGTKVENSVERRVGTATPTAGGDG